MAEHVAGILLAAGDGSRLGQPKAIVEFAGSTLAERGVALLRDGGTDPVIVVTGAIPVEIPGVMSVHNPDWVTGMGVQVTRRPDLRRGRCRRHVARQLP